MLRRKHVPPSLGSRNLRRLLKYWSGSRCCGFWRWPRRERSADIRSDLGQASNAGQRQNQRNPWGARQKGRLAASLLRLQPAAGMRLTRSLPSTPSASTRDPFQYFNSLLDPFLKIVSADKERLAPPKIP